MIEQVDVCKVLIPKSGTKKYFSKCYIVVVIMIITLTTTLIIHKLSGRSNVVHSLIYNLKHYLLWIPEVKP